MQPMASKPFKCPLNGPNMGERPWGIQIGAAEKKVLEYKLFSLPNKLYPALECSLRGRFGLQKCQKRGEKGGSANFFKKTQNL